MTPRLNTPPLTLNNPAALVRRLWATNAPLTLYGTFMLALTVVLTVGIFVDPRVITGAPAWLKPTKFAISTVIYAFTLTWMLGFVKGRPRLVGLVASVTAAAFVIEMLVIVGQAARGMTSHYNVGTPLDAALWAVMAVTIIVLWVMNLLAVVLILLQRFDNPAWAWSLRSALVVTFIGLGLGFLMTNPTAQQMASWQTGAPVTIVGAHSVGVEDGGPGLPIVGWSTEGGDLRIPHFVGMHALQLLPLVGFWISRRRRWPMVRRVRLVLVAAFGYLGVVGLVTAQALRGQSIIAPDALQLGAVAGLVTLTVAAVLVIWRLDGAAERTASA